MMDVHGNDNTPEWGYCTKDGCEQAAMPFWLPDNEPPNDPDGFYCAEHAQSAGWCWGCGGFWGGIETFDFNPRNTGLCENCEPGYLREFGLVDDAVDDNDRGMY
jgi:hypothetical protein